MVADIRVAEPSFAARNGFGYSVTVATGGYLVPVPVINFLPTLVMAVLFGLAMDHHVFLVSRTLPGPPPSAPRDPDSKVDP